MINLEIVGVHFVSDSKIKKYVEHKIGRLDRYIPRQSREAAHGRVVLNDEEGKAKNRFTCEVTLSLPHDVLAAKEATINIYAAVDIVEAKLKSQLLKYKSKNDGQPQRRGRRWLRKVKQFGRPGEIEG